MSTFRFDRNGDSLRPELQALVGHVGLQQGTFKLVVHDGEIRKLIIKPAIRLMMSKAASRRTAPEPTLIRVSEAEPFVHQHLEPLVSALIGEFGSMKVNVKAGRVVDWSFSQRHR